ncbi:Hypothetical protein FBFL15_1899 [Flavobacterium branchiophilum FL-15]|uniref:Uncharacterized protein n=1 Tax=Flavobacterium branchiophilum (strain FL-15) TaxID=1034807 RepID=G2Z207_FLABF|nr:Hypothetical protein FBFL15_1899 [Flavobacterium branchiophilum FL-15]
MLFLIFGYIRLLFDRYKLLNYIYATYNVFENDIGKTIIIIIISFSILIENYKFIIKKLDKII